MTTELSKGLNPAQRQAIEAIEGPLLIVAGPGSGKTRVITERIAYLVKTCGVKPWRIMAVTFTNKAAKEMRERLNRLMGRSAQDLTLGTFHSICSRILRVEAEPAGIDRSFVIYDEDDQSSLIRRSMKDTNIDPKRFNPNAVRHSISAAKAKLLTPVEFAQTKANYFEEVVLRVYERYQELLQQSNAVDFDDLLMRVVRLFQRNKEVLDKYQERYVHVMIDEFQDTSKAQYLFAQQVAGRYRNLAAVGDPDQSIYSWRYADIRNILDFERDYPEAQTILLEQNYRSTRNVLDAAGHVISRNRDRKAKELWTENQQGLPVTISDALNEQDEALTVVNEVEKLVNGGGRRYGDFAVMYRTNAQSRPLEEALVRYGLPYRLVGATRFYERREVKDVLAYLRLLHNPFDDVSLLRVVNVPARGIGQRSLDELTRWASGLGVPLYSALQVLAQSEEERTATPPELPARTVPSLIGFLELISRLTGELEGSTLGELFDLVMERSGYRDYLLSSEDRGEERLENVMELRSVAQEYAHQDTREGLEAFLENVALVSDTDDLDERANAVTLITLHQAKGLEFPMVFIVGVEEGILPHHRSIDDPTQMEEERRLLYVGMTRAQERLYLLRAFRRAAMGQRSINPPSRFLADIPSNLTTSANDRKSRRPAREAVWELASKTGEAPSGPTPFRAGDRVKHHVFGEGVVVSCKPAIGDHEVTVAFKGGGVKRLLQSFARLEMA